jgi:hypothetical protein
MRTRAVLVFLRPVAVYSFEVVFEFIAIVFRFKEGMVAEPREDEHFRDRL